MDGADCAAWIGPQLRTLRHGHPRDVLNAMLTLAEEATLTAKAVETIRGRHSYLARRQDQIAYAAFTLAGYCIGSGIVESANKHVVQARLKGAGMQWAIPSINALLALRCADKNGRWATTWAAIMPRLRHAHRIAPPAPKRSEPTPPPPPAPLPPAAPTPPAHAPYFARGKPTKAHPFNRFPACRAK